MLKMSAVFYLSMFYKPHCNSLSLYGLSIQSFNFSWQGNISVSSGLFFTTLLNSKLYGNILLKFCSDVDGSRSCFFFFIYKIEILVASLYYEKANRQGILSVFLPSLVNSQALLFSNHDQHNVSLLLIIITTTQNTSNALSFSEWQLRLVHHSPEPSPVTYTHAQHVRVHLGSYQTSVAQLPSGRKTQGRECEVRPHRGKKKAVQSQLVWLWGTRGR